jgi:4-amino-4-deoxy-L-arabinose transferase-like glycosyltransferase
MIKSDRISFILALSILLIAAVLRFASFTTLPPGLHADEILDIRLSENVREGYVQVFYNLGSEGREGFYHTMLTAVTSLMGTGMVGYHVLSAWVGMMTLALVYALGRRLHGNLAGLAAMGVLAFGFFPVLLSRIIGRETLLPLLVTAVLLAMALGLPVYWRARGNQTLTTAFAALGILVGVSFYIHPAGMMIALMTLVCVLYVLLLRQQITRRLLSYISFATLVALIVAMPYLVSAIRLPELGGVVRLFEGMTEAGSPPLLQRLTAGLLALGVRGDANPVFNLPGRPLFDPVSVLLLLVGIGAAGRNGRKPRYGILLLALAILLPLALFSPESPSFLAFAVVLPVLALLIGLGVKVIAGRVAQRGKPSPLAAYALAGVAVLLLFNLGWTTLDLFTRWQRLPAVQTAYHGDMLALARRVDTTADHTPTIICAREVSPVSPAVNLTNGQVMGLMQHRQRGIIRSVNCDQSMVFINGGGLQQVLLTEDNTLTTANPFILDWLARAQPIRDARLQPGTALLMEVAGALADTVGRFTTTPVQIPPSPGTAAGSGSQSLPPIRLGGNLTFLGYQLPNVDSYPPGGIVTVTTYWRVDGALPTDLTLFTHLLTDPTLPPVAQTDILSVTPAQLESRDVLVQVTYVPLPPRIPPGRYIVSTGAYQGGDKQRMAVLADDGTRIADRLFLYEIDVRVGE